jgi:hypothetical protein
VTDLELALAAGGKVSGQPTELQQALAAGGTIAGSAPATQLTEPGRAEALGRGALQGVTLGFSDEIAGAIGSLFSDKSYSQIRDESRAANEAARQAHGGFYLGGELVGGAATSVVPGLNIAKGASIATAAGKAALAGGLSGIGSSDKQDFAGVAMDAAKAAAAGAVIGGATQGLSNAISKAPEKAKDLVLKSIAEGEGIHGSATMTAKKALANNEANVIDAASQSFVPEGATKAIKLSDVIGKPAKEVLPILEERLNQVGSQLDQHYDMVDKVTGGVSMQDMVTFLDKEVASLKKSPLNEQYIRAVQDIKNSALEAWAPELAPQMAAQERLTQMGLKNHKMIEDVLVPTRDVRAMVTRLQQRGSQVINPLNPGEASQMKQDMGALMKQFIDQHLTMPEGAAPEAKAAVAAIKEINKTYSGLKTIEKAVEQRGQKEAVGGTSLKGHGFNLLGHGGALGAGLMVAHGNIPGAVASLALPKVLEKAPMAGRAITGAAVKANTMIEALTNAAAQGNPWAKAQLAAMQSVPNAAVVGAGENL